MNSYNQTRTGIFLRDNEFYIFVVCDILNAKQFPVINIGRPTGFARGCFTNSVIIDSVLIFLLYFFSF